MKTAEEYVKDIHGYDLDEEMTDIMVASYKKYARQVASQALKDAAENATYISVGDEIAIVKSSITNTKIELP